MARIIPLGHYVHSNPPSRCPKCPVLHPSLACNIKILLHNKWNHTESIMQAEHQPLQFLLVHQKVVLCLHFQTTFVFLSKFFGRDFQHLIFFMRLQNRYLSNEILGNEREWDETHGRDVKETLIASLRYQQTPCFNRPLYLQWCKVLMVPRIAISTHTGTCHWTGFLC